MPCAVSGRKYAWRPPSPVSEPASSAPSCVLNIKLKSRCAVTFALPHAGQHGVDVVEEDVGVSPPSSSSTRKRALHSRQSTIGSEKPAAWPDASQTRGAWMMAESRPTTRERAASSLTAAVASLPSLVPSTCVRRTVDAHHDSFTRRISSTPNGP